MLFLEDRSRFLYFVTAAVISLSPALSFHLPLSMRVVISRGGFSGFAGKWIMSRVSRNETPDWSRSTCTSIWRVFSSSGTSADGHDSFVERVLSLTGDPLEQDGGKIVVFRGNPAARLMMIGEAPGAEEDKLGKPFVGRSGKLLDEIIRAVGLDPQLDVYISNIVRRRPPNNRPPTPEELEFYLPMLLEEICLVDPDIIVTLGASSTKALLPNETRGITKTRGRWVPHDELLKIHDGVLHVRMIMPWFHPSYLIRNAGERSKQEGGVRWLTREDLREVKRALEALDA